MKFTAKSLAKLLLVVGVVLLVLLILQQPSRCEGFQTVPPPLELYLTMNDLNKSGAGYTIHFSKNNIDANSVISNIYFKKWDNTKKSWSPKLDGSAKWPGAEKQVYDNTLKFENEIYETIKGRNYNNSRSSSEIFRKLPLFVRDIGKSITIKGIQGTENWGTLIDGDPSKPGKPVLLVGLEFEDPATSSAASKSSLPQTDRAFAKAAAGQAAASRVSSRLQQQTRR